MRSLQLHSLPTLVGVLIAGLVAIVGLVPTATTAAATRPRSLIVLNDDTWRQVLEGEWMIKFHAPWCPACRAMVEGWNELARLSGQLDIKVAKADVTVSPALSGRFFITALPTILYVKDGEFQQYRGPRDVQTLQRMIAERKWHHMEPISAWKHPDSVQMTVVAYFFRLSHGLKELNSYLQETYRMPIWLTYAMFAMVTITLGAIIGLLFVCIVDYIVPPRRKTFDELERDGVLHELPTDDLEVDDPEDDSTSDGELYSGADSELEEEKRKHEELTRRKKDVLQMKHALLEGKLKRREKNNEEAAKLKNGAAPPAAVATEAKAAKADEKTAAANGDAKEKADEKTAPNATDVKKRKSRKAD